MFSKVHDIDVDEGVGTMSPRARANIFLCTRNRGGREAYIYSSLAHRPALK